jgi:hypothetical protein
MKTFKYPKTVVFHRNDIIVGYRDNIRQPQRTKEFKALENDLSAQTYGYVVTNYSLDFLELHMGLDYKIIL